jgi:hypothetical protein
MAAADCGISTLDSADQSEGVQHVILIIGCLQDWNLLKRYLFIKYLDGIMGKFILKSEGLDKLIGDSKVVIGEELVVPGDLQNCKS